MYLHGGCNVTPTEDLFVLDLVELDWREVGVDEGTPLQRSRHCIGVTEATEGRGPRIFMFGGVDELKSSSQGLYSAELGLNAPIK